MKNIFTLASLLAIFTSAFSQVTVLQNDFNSYVGTTATVQQGWYYSWNTAASTSGGPSYYTSASYSGAAPNAYKLGGVNGQKDTIITPSFWGADSVSFWCRGAGVPYKQQDTLDIYESPDSSSWTLVVEKDSLPTAGTTLTYSIQPTTNHLMFIYKRATVNGGSVAFDDVMVLSNAVGISAPQSISEINIFPTVSNGFFRIESSEKIQSIEAYTIAGEKIFSFLPSSQRSIPVDASSHPDGIYLLSLKTNSGIITKKIIISR